MEFSTILVVIVVVMVVMAWWWMRRPVVSHHSLNPHYERVVITIPTIEAARDAMDQQQPNAAEQLVEAALDAAREQHSTDDVEVNEEYQRQVIDSLWRAATAYRHGIGAHDAGQNTAAAASIYRYLMESPAVDQVTRADAHAELMILDQEHRNRTNYLDFMRRHEQQVHAPRRVPMLLQQMEAYDFEDLQPVIHGAAIRHRPPQRVDKQNVHDTAMVASMRAGLKKMVDANGGARNVAQDMQMIQQSLPMFSSAQNVLDRMASNHVPLSAYGATEAEILSATWGRIQDPVNVDRRKDLIESLQKNLEDCYEDGQMICATGRTTHAVRTIEGGDRVETVKLQPKWAMDQEVQTTGAHVYQSVLDSCTPDQQHACTVLEEDATPQQLEMQQLVKQQYTDALTTKLTESYKDMLSPEQISARVDSMVQLI